MIRNAEQAARYLAEAPNDVERGRRQRELMAEQHSILARRQAQVDGNGHLSHEAEQALASELAQQRAAAEGVR